MMDLRAYAKYNLNSGPAKAVPWSRLGLREDGLRLNGIRLEWVPNGSRELTPTITKLGEWRGPWQFLGSLERGGEKK
jgi:hypothetical protein